MTLAPSHRQLLNGNKKRMRYTLLILAMCLLGTPLLAQRKNDAQQQYLRGKTLFQQEQWLPAMEAFRQVAADPQASGFGPYASFYFAVSAIKAGRTDDAKAMLRQVQQKNSGWEKQDEVHYWLARVYFEEKNLEQAVAAVENVRDRAVKGDAVNMAHFYLQRDASIDQLKRLLNQYQKADYVADVLARKISRQPVVSQDQRLLSELISRYKLDKELISKPALGTSEMKQAYNVAVMMPFQLENLRPEKNMRDIYFPLDLYDGMKLAQEELAAEGININLHAYDTKKDSLTAVRILRSPEMQAIDLIVGPLYPGETRAALDYAFNQGVNLVNPVSTNPQIIQNNPYAFLFKPSLETQGRKAADFASRTFTPPQGLVIYGTKERDSILATTYKKEMESKGFRSIRMERIRPGDEGRIRNLVVSENQQDMQAGGRLSREALGHVFIASEDEIIVATAMNGLAARKDRLPIIGHESWIKKNLVSNDQLERLGVYLLAPEYMDYSNPNYFAFRDKYLERVHSMPGRYAYLGYDLMMYYGRLMHQYGNLFQESAQQEVYQKGIVCAGFDFQAHRDNQCVTIFQLRNFAPEIVYQ
jgi:ABC-type branched-subunit amino acid transport system substrate-binding protein/predicted negative regulator of RcsB-dependent stress response